MDFRLRAIVRATRVLTSRSKSANVPKGYLAIYVGETKKKRFVIPVSYLNQPGFQDLLSQAEQEFGYNHPMEGLAIPFTEDHFCDVVANCLNG